ncbi:4Fe-4S dicluster domain-containing protein [Tritonibacter horizontis]|uniref:NAD(P)H-quinone oxidoreductase subunit I, chloroplastic n=1 Tax=Tritonibacter horizontis TaxID=1768241 RepID=A0A132BYN8_9RHOB|nr:4Fe-4S binding protein [Tritonibacter horizontis]KUP93501.1 NAD(P)H-quinone oxidoreductase subunit I, chloroplastic [Tritonibacter horizontis]
MSQLTSTLCFCGAAQTQQERRSTLLERACLEARLRRKFAGSGPQVLVLYYNLSVPYPAPLVAVGSYMVANLRACNRACLSRDDILFALGHGFQRVFVELTPDIQLIEHQMRLVAQVTACAGQGGAIALFHSGASLGAMLAEGGGDGAARASGGSERGTSAQGAKPRSEPRRNPRRDPWPEHQPQPGSVAGGCVSVAPGCTLCGQCSWACPAGAIRLGDGGATLEINDRLCSGCGMCVAACPEALLSLQPQMALQRPA